MVRTGFARAGILLALVILCSAALAAPALGVVPGAIVAWGETSGGLDNPPAGTEYTAVAGGFAHSLALKTDGSIVSWGGSNTYGELSNTPTVGVYTAVAAGNYHSLALKSDGTVVAWGLNNYGQCDVPALPEGTTYTAVAGGFLYSLALRDDGTIVAWGANSWGQASPPAPPAGHRYTAVAAGALHGLGLLDDGTIVAWGLNDYGQCDVPALPEGTTYTAVAAGYGHGAALRSDGSIASWGSDTMGVVANTPTVGTYTAIAGGEYHSLALLEDGSIVAWGMNDNGETNTPSGTGFMAIDAGGHYSLALGTIAADTTPPTVVETSPYDGQIDVPVDTAAITVTFDEPVVWDTALGMQVALYDYNWMPVSIGTVDASGNILTIGAPASPWFEHRELPAQEGVYIVQVSGVQDVAGNAMADLIFSFTTVPIDTTPPSVDSTTPFDGANDVATDVTIFATMSEAIDDGTGTVTMEDDYGNTVELQYPPCYYDTTDYLTLTIEPAAPLAAGTVYTVTISGIQDVNGNGMADYTFSFMTAAADTTPPTVTWTSPGSGGTDVSDGEVIYILFSEQVAPGDADLKELVSITPSPGAYSVQQDSPVWISVHGTGSWLALSTTYTVTVTKGGFTDAAGNAMAEDYSWSFTVMDPPAEITGISPASGMRGDTVEVTISGTHLPVTPWVYLYLESEGYSIPVDSPTTSADGTTITGSVTIPSWIPLAIYSVNVVDPGGHSIAPLYDAFTVTTNQLPVASFTATPTTGLAQLKVLFDASASTDSDGTIKSWAWDWGDGTAAGSGATSSHDYLDPGTYVVTLTVTDNDGAVDTETATIAAQTPVQATSDLITRVLDYELSAAVEKALTDPLNTAIAALDNENERGAVKALNAFISQVKAQQKKRTLTSAQATDLITTAKGIIAAI